LGIAFFRQNPAGEIVFAAGSYFAGVALSIAALTMLRRFNQGRQLPPR
jgi:hypothetical protein